MKLIFVETNSAKNNWKKQGEAQYRRKLFSQNFGDIEHFRAY